MNESEVSALLQALSLQSQALQAQTVAINGLADSIMALVSTTLEAGEAEPDPGYTLLNGTRIPFALNTDG